MSWTVSDLTKGYQNISALLESYQNNISGFENAVHSEQHDVFNESLKNNCVIPGCKDSTNCADPIDLLNVPDPIRGDCSAQWYKYINTDSDSGDKYRHRKLKRPSCGGEECPAPGHLIQDSNSGSLYLEYQTEPCTTTNVCDRPRPILNVVGEDVVTYQADKSPSAIYPDEGADCEDWEQGDINEQVMVSGDVVNLANTGKYEIQYNCKNDGGYPARTAERTIYVVSMSCPDCELTDANLDIEIEASFPYRDAGIECDDKLDGKFNASSELVTKTSNVNVERTGTYKVSYSVQNSGGWTNVGNNVGREDLGNCTNPGFELVRTVKVVDTLKPVIGLKFGDDVIHVGSHLPNSATKAGHVNPAKDKFQAESSPQYVISWGSSSIVVVAVCAVALFTYISVIKSGSADIEV
jgi:hypothetical protein